MKKRTDFPHLPDIGDDILEIVKAFRDRPVVPVPVPSVPADMVMTRLPAKDLIQPVKVVVYGRNVDDIVGRGVNGELVLWLPEIVVVAILAGRPTGQPIVVSLD
jgi:hypothetical protein